MTTYIPKLWDMGIDLPDDALRYDPQEKVWKYTEPDWDKLMQLVKGEPSEATATRLHWRRLMWEHHDWVHQIVTGDAPPTAAAA